jgi:hypothetical protein
MSAGRTPYDGRANADRCPGDGALPDNRLPDRTAASREGVLRGRRPEGPDAITPVWITPGFLLGSTLPENDQTST